jgi:hypothetical protein
VTLKWVSVFYNGANSTVIQNGHFSECFSLERGCRQGDPISPYLFIICAEILGIAIRENKGIKGIVIGGIEHKLSQYADEASLFLDDENS